MQIISTKNWKKIKYTAAQEKAIRRGGKKVKTKIKKEIRHRQSQAYDVAKLKSQGLWQESNNRSTLVVTRIQKP